VDQETRLKDYITSLNLPFQYRFSVEYYKLMRSSALEDAIRPLIVIGVDRTLTTEERALIPMSYDGVRIQMEYTQVMDVPEDELKALKQQMEQPDANPEDLIMDGD
ncbi:hypothetical protein SAMD00019534_033000, partial [Acytostelium subglobosum LB1]|uniref:hypothetical protein n=1 Tax=Acytostelium subglobosum LB1 TaxID=1410327 RepID=UPI000644C4E6